MEKPKVLLVGVGGDYPSSNYFNSNLICKDQWRYLLVDNSIFFLFLIKKGGIGGETAIWGRFGSIVRNLRGITSKNIQSWQTCDRSETGSSCTASLSKTSHYRQLRWVQFHRYGDIFRSPFRKQRSKLCYSWRLCTTRSSNSAPTSQNNFPGDPLLSSRRTAATPDQIRFNETEQSLKDLDWTAGRVHSWIRVPVFRPWLPLFPFLHYLHFFSNALVCCFSSSLNRANLASKV